MKTVSSKPKPPPPGMKQVLAPFHLVLDREPLRDDSYTTLTTQAHRPFLPLGLFIWGATDETRLLAVRVRNFMEASLTGDAIPARYFETGRTFEEIVKLAEAGELELSVPERQRLEMEPAEVGNQLAIEVRGKFSNACFWGLTYTHGGPFRSAAVTYAPNAFVREQDGLPLHGEAYQGRLIEHRLGGDAVVLQVQAATEAACVSLLTGLQPLVRY